jgi:hypothetical protein
MRKCYLRLKLYFADTDQHMEHAHMAYDAGSDWTDSGSLRYRRRRWSSLATRDGMGKVAQGRELAHG